MDDVNKHFGVMNEGFRISVTCTDVHELTVEKIAEIEGGSSQRARRRAVRIAELLNTYGIND